MHCLKPITIKNPTGPKYSSLNVACGQCIACRINRRNDWTVRIMHESREHDCNVFVTLTYEDKELPINGVEKKELQDFFKRLRKRIGQFRYFACGEYGELYSRPHYHMILFGVGHKDAIAINKAWNKGRISVQNLEPTSAAYCAKYLEKIKTGNEAEIYEKNKINKEFLLCSTKPAIGKLYALNYISDWIETGFIIIERKKYMIPRAYRKLLTEQEKKNEKIKMDLEKYYYWNHLTERERTELFNYNIRKEEANSYKAKIILKELKKKKCKIKNYKERR